MSHCIDYLCLYNNKTVPVEIINWVVKSVCIYTGHERRLFFWIRCKNTLPLWLLF